MRILIITTIALLTACTPQPDAKDLVWPSDQELFGIEPGGTVSNGLKKAVDICRWRQSGELPSDAEDDQSCIELHTLVMDALQSTQSGGSEAGGP